VKHMLQATNDWIVNGGGIVTYTGMLACIANVSVRLSNYTDPSLPFEIYNFLSRLVAVDQVFGITTQLWSGHKILFCS
jgi:hypothetical protein